MLPYLHLVFEYVGVVVCVRVFLELAKDDAVFEEEDVTVLTAEGQFGCR